MALLNVDPSTSDRLRLTIRAVMGEAKASPEEARRIFGTLLKLLVKIGDEDPDHAGRYKWKLQEFGGSDWGDGAVQPTAGDSFTAFEINGVQGLSGTKAEITLRGKDADGMPVYAFSAVAVGGFVSPYTMLPEDLSTETAQSDDWNVANPPEGTDGVVVTMTTRVVYNADGDEVLYYFTREMLFDSAGKLVTISAETRQTVDTPGDCP